MVLLEAMAAGVPAVSFNVGDVACALTDSNGWLVPADDVSALARAVNDAVANPDGRARRGLAAQGVVRRDFSADAWIRAHLQAYAPVMERRSAE